MLRLRTNICATSLSRMSEDVYVGRPRTVYVSICTRHPPLHATHQDFRLVFNVFWRRCSLCLGMAKLTRRVCYVLPHDRRVGLSHIDVTDARLLTGSTP